MPPSRWTFCLDEVITEPWAAVEDWVFRANPGMPITPVLLAVSWDVRWAEAAAEPAVSATERPRAGQKRKNDNRSPGYRLLKS